MTTPEPIGGLEDALKATNSLREQRKFDEQQLRAHTDMLRVWTVRLVMHFHVPAARAAREAGINRATMNNWLNVARAENRAALAIALANEER